MTTIICKDTDCVNNKQNICQKTSISLIQNYESLECSGAEWKPIHVCDECGAVNDTVEAVHFRNEGYITKKHLCDYCYGKHEE
jgi:hypothetical protein